MLLGVVLEGELDGLDGLDGLSLNGMTTAANRSKTKITPITHLEISVRFISCEGSSNFSHSEIELDRLSGFNCIPLRIALLKILLMTNLLTSCC